MSQNKLLVKLSSMGDVVHSFPALSEAALHGHRFDWVVEEAFAELAGQHPAVDRVIPFGLRRWRRAPLSGAVALRRFVRELRTHRYPFVLDAQGLAKSALLARATGAPMRMGLDSDSAREPWVSRFYTAAFAVDRELHAIDRLRLLFGAALDYPVDLADPAEVTLAADAQGQTETPDTALTLLVHGTTWASKEFPQALWVELIAKLAAAGHRVALLNGGDNELVRAQRLVAQANSGAEAIPPGSLLQAFGRIRAARLVIGVDSGLTHLAAVLGVPTVGLYGSTSAVRTGVRGLHATSLASEFDCAPCLARECAYAGEPILIGGQPVRPACYAELSSERILSAADALLMASSR